jgi:hypothetical protein
MVILKARAFCRLKSSASVPARRCRQIMPILRVAQDDQGKSELHPTCGVVSKLKRPLFVASEMSGFG